MNKAGLRAEMRRRRAACWCERAGFFPEALARELAALPGRWVAGYVPIGTEFSPAAFGALFRAIGKPMCVPAFVEGRGYVWAQLRGELAPGPMRVPQPRELRPVAPGDAAAAFVPGLAFDAAGGRLGYGKGIYDRLLGALPRGCRKIGLCFEAQLAPAVPTEPHDIPMDFLLTENRLIVCQGGSAHEV